MTAKINPQSVPRFNASTMTIAPLESGSYEKKASHESRDLTLREIQTCRVLQECPHPNICGYRGVVVNNGLVTALMFDRYDMNLREFLYSQRSNNMDIPKCIQEIKNGIDHIHSLGLVHCDIKPDNIFVHLASARFVVGDFDSVHREGQRLTLKTGTEGWAPLEADTNDLARREIDFYGLKMIQAWLERKLEHGNDPQITSDEEPYWTTTILGEAREEFLREGNNEYAQNSTGEEESRFDEMDTSW
ncbi:hypothetical protein HBI14_097060 [Parastagonospora nodorum]|nr:hypothetical protein HBI14_097060 [Parastagonospora nodorum]